MSEVQKVERDGRALTSPINGLKGGGQPGPRLATRARAEAVLKDKRLTAANLAEMMARLAYYDPRDFYYSEPGQELYTEDGPVVESSVHGPNQPAWKVGDVKREWSAGDLKPIHELTEAQAQAIVGVEVVMKNAAAGDGVIDRVLKYKFAPREKYVELAARYRNMLVEQIDVRVIDAGSRLDAARQRARERNAKVIDVTPQKAIGEGR